MISFHKNIFFKNNNKIIQSEKHSVTCQNSNKNDAHYSPPITEPNTTLIR